MRPNIKLILYLLDDFLHTSVNVHNSLDMHHNALIFLGESNKKEEPSKISDNNNKRLRIVPGAPTLNFSQGNQSSCIISSLAALYYMGDEIASEYIIRCKQMSLSFIHNKGRTQFCRDILMVHYREKKIRIHYRIQ